MKLPSLSARLARPVGYLAAAAVFGGVLAAPAAPDSPVPLLAPELAAASTEGTRLGVEPFWNYHPVDLGGGWALSVNTASGNLTLGRELTAVGGRGPTLVESLTYNSQSSTDSGASAGWMPWSAQSLTENTDGSVTYRDTDGTRHAFTRNTDGTYAKPAGVHLTLAKVSTGVFTLTDTALTQSRFESGRLVSVTDEKGQRLSLTRDTGGRVTAATDASGRKLTYAYDTSGRLASVTDPANRATTLAYGTDGRLASVTDSHSNVTRFGYGTDGRLLSVTDAKGGVSRVSYDTAGRVAKIADPRTTSTSEFATTFAYDTTTNVTTVTDAGGNRSAVTHNSAGNPIERTDASGKKVQQSWTANELVKQTDATGSLQLTYDSRGNVTATSETLTATTTASTSTSYDARNNPTALVDENGSRTELKYDGASNLTSAAEPARREADANTYDASGNLTSATDPGAATYNIVDNGSFERLGTNGTPVGWGYGGTAGVISVETASARYGANSLKMTSTTTTDAFAFSQMVPAAAGRKFTLSGTGRMDALAGAGAAVGVYFYDSNGLALGWEFTESYHGTGLIDFAVTATAPAGTAKAAVALEYSQASGTVRFDGIQLETPLAASEGHIRSGFDYVDNSSFEYGGRGWAAGGVSGAASVISTDAWGGTSSAQLALSATGTAHLVTGKIGVRPGEPLTLSGVVKTSSVTGGGAYVQVGYHDAAGTSLGGARTVPVTGSTDWRRYALATTAPTGAAYAYVYAVLYNGTGTARFDNVKLVPRSTTTYSYDSGGNYHTGEIDPLGNSTSYSYDAVGNLTAETDPAGGATRTSYDANNRPTALTDAAGGVTRFSYDQLGLGVTVRDPRSASSTDNTYATRFGYDPIQKRTTLTDPLNRATSYTYDRAANLTGTTNPSGSSLTMSYDAAGRPTRKALSTGATYSLGYDAAGNLTSVTDEASRTASYGYDAANRLASETDLWGYKQTLSRDSAGNLTASNDGSKTTSYSYGTNNRLLSVIDPSGRVTRYSYDDTGRPFEIVRGDTLKTVITYDAAGQVTTVADPGNPANAVLSYEYDSRGNLTAATGAKGTQRFGYDALNRLTSWTNEVGAVTNYTYDKAGNLTGKGSRTFTHDAAGQITNTGFTHSADGNLTSDGTHTYTYDAAGRLTKVTKNSDGSTIATYTYDHRGLRTSKTTSSGIVRYHWDHREQLVRESDGTGATLARYTWDDAGELVAIDKAGATYYPHTNARGDILAVTDANMNRVATYEYGPWGELLSQSGTFTQPWRYAGYYHDTETGLYYVQQRYYNPSLSRFLAKEPLYSDFCADCGFEALSSAAPTTSPYAYAYNNPARFRDPDGRHPIIRAGAKLLCKVFCKKKPAARPAASAASASQLARQLAIREARSGSGKVIIRNLGDERRLVRQYGRGDWVKMQHVHNKLRGGRIVVHYHKNLSTGRKVEFKIVSES